MSNSYKLDSHCQKDMNVTISINDIKAVIDEKNIEFIKIGISDFNGVIRGKYLSKTKFFKALEAGMGFCDVILGSDINDDLINGMQSTGWHTGYPDAAIRILPESIRLIPFEPNTLFFLCEFVDDYQAIGPRQVLKRVIDRASAQGLHAVAGMEFEFSAFDETPQTAHDKGYRDLNPISPGNCGYSALRTSAFASFHTELLSMAETMKCPLEGLHTEIGPGVLEAALQATDALNAADQAALFKTFSKAMAQRGGWILSFMAKLHLQQQGHSGHTHMSLVDAHGNNLFYAADSAQQMSPIMRHFIAGQQQLMPEFLALVAPNVNSFTRLVPGYWAPTHATWGVDNRTCSIRAIPGSAKSQRVEYRIPGADVNPYLALAAALASGLYGIEQQLQPTDAIQGNAYQQSHPDHLALPQSLGQAATRLQQSTIARDFFGDTFIDDYVATRHHEQQLANQQITDWQKQRYFELA